MGASERELKHLRQRISNERPVPPRRLQNTTRSPIAVTVRLVWERDGEQFVATKARDWVGRDVLVELFDQRWSTRGIWLDASDVRRR